MAELKITSFPISSNAGLVKISGQVDVNNYEQLEDELNRLIESGVNGIGVDASELESMSSAGLGALINLAILLRDRQGLFMMTNPRQDVLDLMELLGVKEIFGIVDKLDVLKRELMKVH